MLQKRLAKQPVLKSARVVINLALRNIILILLQIGTRKRIYSFTKTVQYEIV